MTGQKWRLLIAILIIEALTIARHEIDNQNKPERKKDSLISPQRQNNEAGMLYGDLSFKKKLYYNTASISYLPSSDKFNWFNIYLLWFAKLSSTDL